MPITQGIAGHVATTGKSKPPVGHLTSVVIINNHEIKFFQILTVL